MRRIALLSSILTASIVACSPGPGEEDGGATSQCGTLSCPTGCTLLSDCATCAPDGPDAGIGNSCEIDTDCCSGYVCSRGACTYPPSTSGATSSSTSGSSGTTSTSSSGGTSGNPCSAAPAGSACATNTDCAGGDGFYCTQHGDAGFCKAKCPTCACLGTYVCDDSSGICEAPAATSSSTSGAVTTTTATGTTSGTTHSSSSSSSGVTSSSTTGTSSSTSGHTSSGTSSGTTTHGATSSSSTSGTTTSGTTGTGTTSGTIAVGDTCASCFQDSDCAGASDDCVGDPTDENGYCAPSCATGGSCSAGYSCSPETDDDGVTSIEVCYPNSGTCSGGSTSGNIPVGDTCSPCNSFFDCSGQTDWCVIDQSSGSGECAPDCSSGGTCSTGYTCASELDSDGFDTDEVCYPTSGSCSGSGGTGGSTGGGSNVGSTCSNDSSCTSDYCRGGVCTCNCSGGNYPCASDADCCTGPGQGNSCSSRGFSTGCAVDPTTGLGVCN